MTTDVYIGGALLTQVEKCRFLGLTLDNKLKWKSQISEIMTKICKLIDVIQNKK